MRALVLILLTLAASGTLLGCASRRATLREIERLERSAERARGAGADWRAPAEIARAQARLRQAHAEYAAWDDDVDPELEAARGELIAAWRRISERRPATLLRGIYFAEDSFEITANQRPVLEEAVALLVRERNTAVIVQGFTSASGDPHDDYHLSEQRAEAVAQYFLDKGIDPGRIGIAPHGGYRPAASNRRPSGRAENRRVAFRVLRVPPPYLEQPRDLAPPAGYPFPSKPRLDPAPGDGAFPAARKKFSRGAYNLTCGWLEIPRSTVQEISGRNPLAGAGLGLARGTGLAAVRTGTGAIEIVSFPVRVPRDRAFLDPAILDLRHIF